MAGLGQFAASTPPLQERQCVGVEAENNGVRRGEQAKKRKKKQKRVCGGGGRGGGGGGGQRHINSESQCMDEEGDVDVSTKGMGWHVGPRHDCKTQRIFERQVGEDRKGEGKETSAK